MGICPHCGFYKRKIVESSHGKLASMGLSLSKSMTVTGLGDDANSEVGNPVPLACLW